MTAPDSLDEAAATAARYMEGFGAPWCVGGGWAADLYLDRRTRPHADLDLVVLRGDQGRLHAHFAGWEMRKAVNGALLPWLPGERLYPPVHEVHARSPRGEPLELLLNDHHGAEWVYRRHPAVRLSLAELIVPGARGVPVLAPAVVLLYKCKAPRAADEHDFAHLRPALPSRDRSWLAGALARAHPGHPWQAWLERMGQRRDG